MNRIYSRLGYRKATTELDRTTEERIARAVREALLVVELSACYAFFPITGGDEGSVVLDGVHRFESHDFVRMLTGSSGVALFACTAGERITRLRDTAMHDGNVTDGVIYDAVGSEMAEECAEYLHSFIGKLVEREGRMATKRRYSPGYGDLALSAQSAIFNMIDPQQIGISLTESFLMTPEKSVTAFIGLCNR